MLINRLKTRLVFVLLYLEGSEIFFVPTLSRVTQATLHLKTNTPTEPKLCHPLPASHRKNSVTSSLRLSYKIFIQYVSNAVKQLYVETMELFSLPHPDP